ncbi:type II toxin-antitoxin system RelE/ParE family toxin [Oceanobacillus saliphilus]|uniref:type II toxin-antitoxin system RelE/ParE family toxin n=1 Tax=Oceanobacillus saliphilus TaxID=2925834 RepID=UPI00201D6FBA|nr:type II toxin-antitoxin system RelE/ParE family toxin [Oceanobacillus saliphilus]
MITNYNLELLPTVDADLDDLFDYILLDNPNDAGDVLERIITSLKNLEDFPYAGTKLIADH